MTQKLLFAEERDVEQVLEIEYTIDFRCVCCDMPVYNAEPIEPLGQERLNWWDRHVFSRSFFETCDCRYFDDEECTCGKCCDHCICGAFGSLD